MAGGVWRALDPRQATGNREESQRGSWACLTPIARNRRQAPTRIAAGIPATCRFPGATRDVARHLPQTRHRANDGGPVASDAVHNPVNDVVMQPKKAAGGDTPVEH
jgi:hypothetical protein